jgi:hypothetical protein
MRMVGHPMTFQNLAFFLPSQRMENRPEGPPGLPKQNFSPLFGVNTTWYLQSHLEWDKL